MGKLPLLWPVDKDDAQDDDPEDIHSMHDEDGGWDKPYFVPPRPGEKQKQNGNLKKLFEPRAGVVYDEGRKVGLRRCRVHTATGDKVEGVGFGDVKVDPEYIFKYPCRSLKNRPCHKLP